MGESGLWQLTAILITEGYYIYKKTILPAREIAHWPKSLFRVRLLFKPRLISSLMSFIPWKVCSF